MKTLILAAVALAACAPPPAGQPSTGIATLVVGETARIAGVSVRAVRLEEDSRCPTNVQCVHAGTVRLRVLVEGQEMVLRLDEPAEARQRLWLRLAAVCPAPLAPAPIERAAYRFTLTAAEGTAPPPLDHACPRAP